MIENNTEQLSGQFELEDFLGEDKGTQTGEVPDGYDAEGHLLNEDYAPEVPQTPAPDRLTVIAGEIATITQHARVVLASAAIDIGKRLIEAQGLVPEGRWGEWLEKNVDYSQRQAQVMMQLADQFGRGELPEVYRGLGISHMTALLAAPEEAREDMARRVKDEDLSVRELQAQIKRLKEANKDAEQQAFDLRQDLNVARRTLEDVESARDNAQANLDAVRGAIEREREAARIAQAKAAAAEASADELRKMHSDAEDWAAIAAQRASDAVNRANQTAKDLSAARAEIARLEAEKAAMPEPEARTVEVVPEAVTKELEALRARLAEAEAKAAPTVIQAPEGPTASEKFKWFYANQMKPAFTTALSLLQDVAREDAHAADLYATALTKGCQQLLNQLGTKEG